ncbi:SMODS domain-containing nucleotidyltransferase [Pseudactinotalea terrae]|uniref:SMODS domain-containing nucleotidyltransferase n=1 Tax=Pseudactinotalea terrae TaxID=1743262 RepID=UPI0012E22F8F|nr:hypothetical protein [Pseudactinotalea terrae]
MSACNEEFKTFLNDHVNINQTRWDNLLSRVSTLNDFINESPTVGEHVNDDVIPQGSYARRTIIRPVTGKDYDADVLVPMNEVDGWEPEDYIPSLQRAFEASARYAGKSTMKKRCLRVQYSDAFHVDLVPFVERVGGKYITHRTENRWILQDPTALTEWFEGQNRAANYHLVKAVRLVKYLREHSSAEIPSVVLTTLLASQVSPYGDPTYNSVASTLNTLLSALDTYLTPLASPPFVDDRSGYGENLANRWSQTDFEAFKSRLRTWASKAQTAYAAPYAESGEKWRSLFGTDFGTAAKPAALQAADARGESGMRTGLAPGEQTLTDLGIVERLEPRYHVKMIGRFASRKMIRFRRLPSTGDLVPIGRRLKFEVEDCNVEGVTYYWKVRNFGAEAQRRHMERGAIEQRGAQITETADFAGPHWVQVWAVKNGVALATSRQEVTIIPK